MRLFQGLFLLMAGQALLVAVVAADDRQALAALVASVRRLAEMAEDLHAVALADCGRLPVIDDSAPGVDVELARHLLEPFCRTTRAPGESVTTLGVGLARPPRRAATA